MTWLLLVAALFAGASVGAWWRQRQLERYPLRHYPPRCALCDQETGGIVRRAAR